MVYHGCLPDYLEKSLSTSASRWPSPICPLLHPRCCHTWEPIKRLGSCSKLVIKNIDPLNQWLYENKSCWQKIYHVFLKIPVFVGHFSAEHGGFLVDNLIFAQPFVSRKLAPSVAENDRLIHCFDHFDPHLCCGKTPMFAGEPPMRPRFLCEFPLFTAVMVPWCHGCSLHDQPWCAVVPDSSWTLLDHSLETRQETRSRWIWAFW